VTVIRRQELYLPALAPPISHYTHAVVCDQILYVSGILAHRPPEVARQNWDAVAQTRRVLEDLRQVLAEVDAGPEDVVRVTVYVTDMADRQRVNPVRQAFFGEARPASTLVQVAALADPEALVEIEAIACAWPTRGPTLDVTMEGGVVGT
jgi:2-iminobutanoate/2-iminopropanoate deaminase